MYRVKARNFFVDLVEEFFTRPWLMFHALLCRRGYANTAMHKDFDAEKRKRFGMLLANKIEYFCDGDDRKVYHVRVDPLLSRYKKADEAAFKIVGSVLKRELGLAPLKTLITRDSKTTDGIQVADLLLGATLADWQGLSTAPHKKSVRQAVAAHLGWPDTRSDTYRREWKFNIWYFHDPTRGLREVATRPVKLRFPMNSFVPRRR